MQTPESKLTPANNLYSGVQLCVTLKAKQKCFRILKYREGTFAEIFHEHVPKHRISNDNAIACMKTLIARHRSLGDFDVLRGYLNKRGKKPSAMEFGQVHVEYPEPGVLRKYLSHFNTTIFVDEVISPDKFRR